MYSGLKPFFQYYLSHVTKMVFTQGRKQYLCVPRCCWQWQFEKIENIQLKLYRYANLTNLKANVSTELSNASWCWEFSRCFCKKFANVNATLHFSIDYLHQCMDETDRMTQGSCINRSQACMSSYIWHSGPKS